MTTVRHVIGGEERASADGRTFPDVDPATREPWAEVAHGGRAEVDAALDAARAAFPAWGALAPEERATRLHAVADAIATHASELALLDTADMGKPVTQALSKDVPRAAQNFRFFADWAAQAGDEALRLPSGHLTYTECAPAGVSVAISPWNFPLMLATWKVAPALAFGCTVVLKPAEDTPASAARLATLALDAGLPPGVLNVVHGFGPDDVGEWLTRDARVDRITFTGESGTGRAIMRAAADHLVPVSFELGGKGANLVFADADLDAAVDWSLKAIFTNAGQVCLAGSRLYVERPAYEEFLARFAERAEAMVLGDPRDPATEVGPLASAEHHAKVAAFLDLVPEEGGKLLCGGLADGWWVRPTVVAGADQRGRLWREEIFGPVVVVAPFDTEDEAVALANDTPYGLNAMLFTEHLRRAHRVASRLRAGTVWVNCFFVRDLRAPFGGAGDSGIGREGGRWSREFFTEPKAIVLQP